MQYFNRASDIIKNVRTIFETLDTRLSDPLSDEKTLKENICQTEVLDMALEKKSRLTRSIEIELTVKQFEIFLST